MQDTSNGLWVGEHASDLAHRAIGIDSVKLARVHVGVPIGHVDNKIVVLDARVGEFRKEAPGVQVVVVLVDLADGFAYFEMSLKVIHPMPLGAVDGNTAIGTFKVCMSWGLTGSV